jgi:PAS domain S-box-containing protein
MLATRKYADSEFQNSNNTEPSTTRERFERPDPINKEIELAPKRYIMSKTDPKGIIEYGNEYFVEISGYKESELIGRPHNIIRHPDMPKIVFKLMWDRLENRKNIYALVKNLAKSGRYYWVMTDFDVKINKSTNETVSYFAYRRAAPKHAVKQIEKVYAKLIEIEKERGMAGSEKYLLGFLEERGQTYDQYIDEITKNNSFVKLWFKAMKKFFSAQNHDRRDQDGLA